MVSIKQPKALLGIPRSFRPRALLILALVGALLLLFSIVTAAGAGDVTDTWKKRIQVEPFGAPHTDAPAVGRQKALRRALGRDGPGSRRNLCSRLLRTWDARHAPPGYAALGSDCHGRRLPFCGAGLLGTWYVEPTEQLPDTPERAPADGRDTAQGQAHADRGDGLLGRAAP